MDKFVEEWEESKDSKHKQACPSNMTKQMWILNHIEGQQSKSDSATLYNTVFSDSSVWCNYLESNLDYTSDYRHFSELHVRKDFDSLWEKLLDVAEQTRVHATTKTNRTDFNNQPQQRNFFKPVECCRAGDKDINNTSYLYTDLKEQTNLGVYPHGFAICRDWLYDHVLLLSSAHRHDINPKQNPKSRD